MRSNYKQVSSDIRIEMKHVVLNVGQYNKISVRQKLTSAVVGALIDLVKLCFSYSQIIINTLNLLNKLSHFFSNSE